jgi:hypothetical protein
LVVPTRTGAASATVVPPGVVSVSSSPLIDDGSIWAPLVGWYVTSRYPAALSASRPTEPPPRVTVVSPPSAPVTVRVRSAVAPVTVNRDVVS